MAEPEKIADDEWRLDNAPPESVEHEPARLAPPTTALAPNLSHERLTRAVYVVTTEHLAWYLVVAWALITRMAALGARPLDAPQGADALSSLALAANGHDALGSVAASWVTILQGWIFAAVPMMFGLRTLASIKWMPMIHSRIITPRNTSTP